MLTKTPGLSPRFLPRATGPAPRPVDARRAPEPPHVEGELRLFRQKLAYLTNRGFWPDIEALAREHGWDSPNLRQFIDKRIPTSRCPSCGQDVVQFRSYTRFCSDSCRRSYRKQGRENEVASGLAAQGLRSLA